MGQAKLRGTREERVEQAAERKRIEHEASRARVIAEDAERQRRHAEDVAQLRAIRAANPELAAKVDEAKGVMVIDDGEAIARSVRRSSGVLGLHAAVLAGAAAMLIAEPTKRRG